MLHKWLQDALDHSGLDQAELARRLTERLGRSIDRAAVNKMLKEDGRKIAGDEMLAIEDIADFPAPQHRIAGAYRVAFGGKIGAGGSIDTSSWQSEPGIEYEVELAAQFPDAVIAYQVVGDSMFPVYEPDEVILCRAHTQDIEKHFGRRAAIGTVEHGRQLKVIHPGSGPKIFDLESLNRSVATMRNVKVEWAARICATIPADEWRILERRAQRQERLKKPSQRRA